MGPAVALYVYGQLCAATLAHAHARSGGRIAIAAYLGRGDVFDLQFSRSARRMPSKTIATTRPSATPSRPAKSVRGEGAPGRR